MVAGGVASVGEEKFVFRAFLRASAREIAFALLGHDVADVALLGLEVVVHRRSLVVGAVVVEYRLALNLACRVGASESEYRIVAQIHLYLGGIQLDIAVSHRSGAVHECRVTAYDEHRVR